MQEDACQCLPGLRQLQHSRIKAGHSIDKLDDLAVALLLDQGMDRLQWLLHVLSNLLARRILSPLLQHVRQPALAA